MTGERIGAGRGRANMVNGRPSSRFANLRDGPAANRAATARMSEKVTPTVRIRRIFDRYLSDLYSPLPKRIGALGQAPTFPDDSEAELQEVCVTLRRCVRMEGLWRRL